MPDSFNWLFIIVGAVLILAEVILGASTGFDFLLLGSAILLGGLLGLVTDNTILGVATAGLLSLAYIFLGRRQLRNRLRKPGIPSNVDALIGKTAVVVEAIEPQRPGRVKYEGEEWRAQTDAPATGPIEPGRNVRIVRVDGVTTFVVALPVDNPAGGSNP